MAKIELEYGCKVCGKYVKVFVDSWQARLEDDYLMKISERINEICLCEELIPLLKKVKESKN